MPEACVNQPLEGLRVVEFTHMVMGPTCGMVLADLGAEVIKLEPIEGDHSRRLLGAGAGFFPMFNRNKKSIGVDLRQPEGAALARRLCATADVVAENFKPGTMEKYGLDYASLSGANPKLIYATCKGFLPGPYDHRTALDEVVQMMGGLAYMTGRPGDPLRAGTSVNDIMGGLFAAIGVLGALIQRGISGKGMEVQSALYENNVFLVGHDDRPRELSLERPRREHRVVGDPDRHLARMPVDGLRAPRRQRRQLGRVALVRRGCRALRRRAGRRAGGSVLLLQERRIQPAVGVVDARMFRAGVGRRASARMARVGGRSARRARRERCTHAGDREREEAGSREEASPVARHIAAAHQVGQQRW